MLNEVFFCEGCEEFFETTEDMAITIRCMLSDPDVAHVSVLCDSCTLVAMIIEAEDSESCYRCGDALSLEDGDICYHCAYDELEEEQGSCCEYHEESNPIGVDYSS